jgi:hypothetical protein
MFLVAGVTGLAGALPCVTAGCTSSGESGREGGSRPADGGGGRSPDAAPPSAPFDAAGFASDANPPTPCNGTPSYCDVAYDQLTYVVTHAAMAYVTPPFLCTSQDVSPRAQLDQGVRALEIEAHVQGGTGDAEGADDGGASVVLCAGDCSLGSAPIGETLDAVNAFLSVNPREVVTLLVEGGVDEGDLAAAFSSAGLDSLALVRTTKSDPWPTLQGMISGGTRLVIFADVTGAPPAWMLPLRTYVGETGVAFESASAMTCDVAVGSASAPLYLLNEYLVTSDAGGEGGVCGSPALAEVANAELFFGNRVSACTQQRGVRPMFLAVDFFEMEDTLGAARTLNPMP